MRNASDDGSAEGSDFDVHRKYQRLGASHELGKKCRWFSANSMPRSGRFCCDSFVNIAKNHEGLMLTDIF
jgi:hypothetical protein